MSWSHSFKALLATALVVGLLAVAPVAAVTVSDENLPEEQRVGQEDAATFTLSELYTDYETWTLRGETNLTEVTWTVRKFDQAGNQISQQSYGNATFNESVDIEEDTSTIEVRVTGAAPEVRNYTYDPAQNFTFADLTLVRPGGGTERIERYSVHHYTEDSKTARMALDEARRTLDDTGGSQEARNQFERAVIAYENPNFELAKSLAEDAENSARQAQRTRDRNQLLLYGAIGLLVLLAAVGGIYYYQSQRDDYGQLR
jgi:hypothetical protein